MKKIIGFWVLLVWSNVLLADPMATHGMLLFGNQTSYVSHWPMYHNPHNYQFIGEVELTDIAGQDTLKKYKNAQETWSGIFSIKPELMDLSEVIKKNKTTFQATIYAGHFEKPGAVNLGSVMISVEQIIIGHEINQEAGPSLLFKTFGKDGEYFTAHIISGQPTYDAIYQTEKPSYMHPPRCTRYACSDPHVVTYDDIDLPITTVALNADFASAHPQNVAVGNINHSQIHLGEPIYLQYEELEH